MLALAAVAAACAACGSDTTPPVTGSPSAQATPASRNLVQGEVVAIKGSTATVSTTDGSDATFTVDQNTTVTQFLSDDISDLVVGQCAFATGEKDIRGYVVAVYVRITAKGPNGCTRPSGATAGQGGEAGGFRRGRGAAGQGGAAAGGLTTVGGPITAVSGLVFTVSGPSGDEHFTAGPTTPVTKFVNASLSTVHNGMCVVARGRRDSFGKVVAVSLTIVPAAVTGCFTGNTAGLGVSPGG